MDDDGNRRAPMTESEKIEFLGGQVHALIGFATAVITASADPSRLGRHLDFVGQINLARAEGSLVSDVYVEGVQDIQDRLRRAVEMALKHRVGPKDR
jgi:hypothetical protein